MSAYFFGKTLLELPLLVIYPLIFNILIFYMIGLEGGFSKLYKCHWHYSVDFIKIEKIYQNGLVG